jgi:hypothetical protein
MNPECAKFVENLSPYGLRILFLSLETQIIRLSVLRFMNVKWDKHVRVVTDEERYLKVEKTLPDDAFISISSSYQIRDMVYKSSYFQKKILDGEFSDFALKTRTVLRNTPHVTIPSINNERFFTRIPKPIKIPAKEILNPEFKDYVMGLSIIGELCKMMKDRIIQFVESSSYITLEYLVGTLNHKRIFYEKHTSGEYITTQDGRLSYNLIYRNPSSMSEVIKDQYWYEEFGKAYCTDDYRVMYLIRPNLWNGKCVWGMENMSVYDLFSTEFQNIVTRDYLNARKIIDG